MVRSFSALVNNFCQLHRNPHAADDGLASENIRMHRDAVEQFNLIHRAFPKIPSILPSE